MPSSSFTRLRASARPLRRSLRPRWSPAQHWKRLAEAAARSSRAELSRRASTIQRAVEQHGVTYNIYGDPKGTDRPWEVDLLPLIISTEEWHFLAQAMQQRARLLNAVLADLYGPGRLLAQGLSHRPSFTVITIISGHAGGSSRSAVLFSILRLRSCPLSRRSMVGYRRSDPGSLWCRLCGAKPAYRHAAVWTPLPLAWRAAAGGFFSHLAATVGGSRAHRRRGAAHRALDTGAIQRNLL